MNLSLSPLVVIGSINLDLIIHSERRPALGETLIGSNFLTLPGGKGANQAVAATRFINFKGNSKNSPILMIGCLGADNNGMLLKKNLQEQGVNTQHITTSENSPSGVALINNVQGKNSIVINRGANALVTPSLLESKRKIIAQASIVLLQHEIPLETIESAVELCHQLNIICIVNPAPAIALPPALIKKISYLTPNEYECEITLNPNNKFKNRDEILKAYPNQLIVTEGSQGLVYHDQEKKRIDAHKVAVVDSTGAGDTFNGVLAAAFCEKMSLKQAVVYANAAAGLSTTKLGAQTAPSREELELFLKPS